MTAGDGVTYHVVFYIVGQQSAGEVPASLGAAAQTLGDLRQRVSFVDDVPSGAAAGREITCDVLTIGAGDPRSLAIGAPCSADNPRTSMREPRVPPPRADERGRT